MVHLVQVVNRFDLRSGGGGVRPVGVVHLQDGYTERMRSGPHHVRSGQHPEGGGMRKGK